MHLSISSSIKHVPLFTGSRLAWALIPVALACLELLPAPHAFGVTPAPDGAYAGANTAEGQSALQNLTTGIHNTSLGYQTLFNNTVGHDNMATGFQALFKNVSGNYNMANGSQALYNNTAGNFNAATGFRSLYSNTTASDNTAYGFQSLAFNTTGSDNTATGFKALYINQTGVQNTATGALSLYNNTTGGHNFAGGYQALYNNTTGNYNMANGYQALYSNTTGFQNTANGVQALFHNTTGSDNTAFGFTSLALNTTGQNNTSIGFNALFNSTGSRNIALGQSAGFALTSGDDNIYIGNQGSASESDTIRIGDGSTQTSTYIAGIAGASVTGSAVFIDTSTGQLGLMSSSARFKDSIEPMGSASDVLLSLRPVKFHYKEKIDPKGTPQFGLVAEDVEKVDPDLVVRDAKGKVFTVRYEAVNAMLLNEFLKEHSTVQAQQKQIQALAAQVREQAALLQKVSDRLELNKPTPQMVDNNQ